MEDVENRSDYLESFFCEALVLQRSCPCRVQILSFSMSCECAGQDTGFESYFYFYFFLRMRCL